MWRLAAILFFFVPVLGCQSREASAPRLSASQLPVIFLGLDGADWLLLDELIARGAMPNLARLVAEGRSGVLATEHPPLSPLLWTTMMSGVGPLAHGILDFARLDSQSGRREPIASLDRRVPAIWNMASSRGLEVAVIGFWATHPAEPVEGLLVSDRLFAFSAAPGAELQGGVYPVSEESWVRDLLDREERAVGARELAAYLPGLREVEYSRQESAADPYSRPLSALRRVLVETRQTHRLAREWLGRRQPWLTAVYFQGPDVVGHLFAPYLAPRQEGVTEEEFERFSAVPARYFAELDSMLGDYLKVAQAREAILFLASDHGFFWKEGRPTRLQSAAAATAAKWHRDEGIYLLWGPGIEPAPGARARGRIAQVCATLLALLGLPPGQGLAGPPLTGAPHDSIEPVAEVKYGTSYRQLPATAVGSGGGEESAEELAQLRALGYLTPTEAGEVSEAPPPGWRAGEVRTPASYNNEGLLLGAAGRGEEAQRAFEHALALDPGSASAAWNLSELLLTRAQDLDRADRLLALAVARGLPDGEEQTGIRARRYSQEGQAARGLALLDLVLAGRPQAASLRMLRGRLRLEAGECAGALEEFRAAAELRPEDALAHASAGLAALCLGEREQARSSLRRSLELDPDQPEIERALGDL